MKSILSHLLTFLLGLLAAASYYRFLIWPDQQQSIEQMLRGEVLGNFTDWSSVIFIPILPLTLITVILLIIFLAKSKYMQKQSATK